MIAREINVNNYNAEIELINPTKLFSSVLSSNEIITNVRYDLRVESNLKDSLNLTLVPPINPEDSQYRKFSKLAVTTENSERVTLEFKSVKNDVIIRSLDFFNFGGTWRENLIDSEYVDIDDSITVTVSGNSINGNSYLRLVGNYVAEAYLIDDFLPVVEGESPTGLPLNIGKEVDVNTPTLIVPENLNRARLTLVNVGFTGAYIAFGDEQEATYALDSRNCLLFPPQATWNDSERRSIIVKSAVWGQAVPSIDSEGNALNSTEVTGVELSFV